MLPFCIVWHFSPVIPPLLDAPGQVRGSGSSPGCRETGGGNLFFPFPACEPCAHLPASLPPSCPVFPAVFTHTKQLLCGRLGKRVSNGLIRASGWCASGWVPGESRHSRTHPPSLGEPRDALDPALDATSMTLLRAWSRFLFKPHLQQLGPAFINHLHGESLVRATGWVVLWRQDFFPLSPKSHQVELFRSSQPAAQLPRLLQKPPA